MIHKSVIAALLIILFASLPCLGQQPDAKSILLSAAAALERHHSVQCSVAMERKSFAATDAFACNGTCTMIRDPSDPVLGGKFWYTTHGDTILHDEITWFYDLDLFYTIDAKNKTATTYYPHHPERGVATNVRDALLWRNFLRPQRIKDLVNDTISYLGEKDIKGDLCYEVMIKMPAFGEGNNTTQQTTWLYISKTDSIPILQQWISQHQGKTQYNELYISRYAFDAVQDLALSAEMLSSYRITPYNPNPDLYKTLDSGTIAPLFSGRTYQHNFDSVAISFKNQVTLLDFWYQDCHWCVKSIPQIEKINEKYTGTSFQLIGVNSYDNNKEDLKRLPRFFHYNPMGYKTILVDTSVPNSYSVNGWPVFYVIDKHGRIAFSQVGYSDDLYDKLDKAIAVLLK
jgi:thiol-disulfide isomerase/thioredoxin